MSILSVLNLFGLITLLKALCTYKLKYDIEKSKQVVKSGIQLIQQVNKNTEIASVL